MCKNSFQQVYHEFEPIYNEKSKVLILGTFPSVKSREGQFYYHHPQNRFWKVMAALTKERLPQTISDKKELLLNHHIAIWDVVQSCQIKGSSDSSIRNVVPTDLSWILEGSQVKKIFANGKKAGALYQKYQQQITGMEAIVLPSTSPANAAWSFERLYEEWKRRIKGNTA